MFDSLDAKRVAAGRKAPASKAQEKKMEKVVAGQKEKRAGKVAEKREVGAPESGSQPVCGHWSNLHAALLIILREA